jgi:hypothetical protein
MYRFTIAFHFEASCIYAIHLALNMNVGGDGVVITYPCHHEKCDPNKLDSAKKVFVG